MGFRHLGDGRIAGAPSRFGGKRFLVRLAQLNHPIVLRIFLEDSRVLVVRSRIITDSLRLFSELQAGRDESIKRLLVLAIHSSGDFFHQIDAVGINLSGLEKGTFLLGSLSVGEFSIQLDFECLTPRPLLGG